MTKTKNPGAGAVKAPKPAAAKPGVVKPFSKAAAKPGLSKPVSKGNQNSTCAQATSTFEQAGKKRARSPEASEAEPGRRKRREPARFGEFQQPSPGSLGSPDSQLGIQNTVPEPVGAAEARDAEALNKAAARFLGQYLDEADEGPGIREQLAPMIEQMHADRAVVAKTKAEAKQKAQQAADRYVPVDQRKLPSPIKRCPQLEIARANLYKGDRKKPAQSTVSTTPSGEVPNPSPQPRPVDSDRERQAAKGEVSNLRAQLVLKEGEVENLEQQLKQQLQVLTQHIEELQSENKRLTAALSEAQSTRKKAAKAKKEQNRRGAEVQGLTKQLDLMSEQLATFSSDMETMRNRLKELEDDQS